MTRNTLNHCVNFLIAHKQLNEPLNYISQIFSDINAKFVTILSKFDSARVCLRREKNPAK